MSDFYQVLGSKHADTPACLVETWDDQPPLDPEDGRKCIISFALAMRDRLLSKSAAKDLLKGWSSLDDALIDSEVDRAYDSEERLSCEIMHSCIAISQNCQKEFCDYPSIMRDRRAWHGADAIKVEEVCEISTNSQGNQTAKFSPDKAAAALIKEYPIVSTPDERIWVYRDGVYGARGDVFVDQILDRSVGDLYTSRMASETHRKIVLRTLQEYSTFDSNPYLFAVENGVVDMATGQFMPHDPKFFLTQKSPVRYDSTATCPEVEKFLGSALGTVDNVLSFLDVMTAKTTDLLFEYFVVMIGGGANGKSKAEELIRAFFGDEAIAEVDIATLTQNRFDRKEIFKKKFLINSEVSGDEKESRWIKYISGGGRLDADQKGREHIQFRPRCIIIIDTNDPPRFADASYGFQRRLVKIDFPNTFVDCPLPENPNEKQKDPFVIQKITSLEELSGLLNLLIMRAPDVLPECKIHRRDGKTLAEEYEMQANSMQEFFDKFCEMDSSNWIPKSSLYSYYKDFCKKINAVPKSQTAFNKYASKTLKLEEARKHLENVGYARVFWGVGLDELAFTEFVQNDTDNLPPKSISGPGLPTLPTLREIVNRVVYGSSIGESKHQKNPGKLGNLVPDNEKVGQNPDKTPVLKLLTIYILKSISKFVGVDGTYYGPFRPDEVSALPEIHAINLVNKGLARLISIRSE